jgi:hypothetical protein
MAGLTEFYCGWNEPSHASQFKWLEYTFKNSVNPKKCYKALYPDQKLCSLLNVNPDIDPIFFMT